ncbi:MAG: division/cell wall cluster transcriptional repressor MraZ [Chloroflexi bacterium RBG_16_51_16]|nr:MAG: division/cell wall cluster transcriptional repressor MraZ [Chloroflexi bacterium RBG_16_51_16]
MFLGQFQHNVDEKGRLMVPARFRELLEGGAYITQGFDHCLMVMTEPYFNQVYERLNALNLTELPARQLRRQMLSNAYPVEIDKIGRILIPQNLRSILTLNGEAVLAGQGEYFEVWTPVDWNKQQELLKDTDTINQRFATLNLSRASGS